MEHLSTADFIVYVGGLLGSFLIGLFWLPTLNYFTYGTWFKDLYGADREWSLDSSNKWRRGMEATPLNVSEDVKVAKEEVLQTQFSEEEYKESHALSGKELVVPEKADDYSRVTGIESFPVQTSGGQVNAYSDEFEDFKAIRTELSNLQHDDEEHNDHLTLMEGVLTVPEEGKDCSPENYQESSSVQISEDEVQTHSDDLEPIEELEVTWRELFQIQYNEAEENRNMLLENGFMVPEEAEDRSPMIDDECKPSKKKRKPRPHKNFKKRFHKRFLKEFEEIRAKLKTQTWQEIKTPSNTLAGTESEDATHEKANVGQLIKYLAESGAEPKYLSVAIRIQQELKQKEIEERAKMLSAMESPKLDQYTRNYKEYLPLTIRAFALRNFSLLLRTKISKRLFAEAVTESLPIELLSVYSDMWGETEQTFNRLYFDYLTEEEHGDFMQKLLNMNLVAEKVDADTVEKEMMNLGWKVMKVKRKSYKWGGEMFHYDRIAI